MEEQILLTLSDIETIVAKNYTKLQENGLDVLTAADTVENVLHQERINPKGFLKAASFVGRAVTENYYNHNRAGRDGEMEVLLDEFYELVDLVAEQYTFTDQPKHTNQQYKHTGQKRKHT
jgi:hypothetical protein